MSNTIDPIDSAHSKDLYASSLCDLCSASVLSTGGQLRGDVAAVQCRHRFID